MPVWAERRVASVAAHLAAENLTGEALIREIARRAGVSRSLVRRCRRQVAA